MKKLYDLAVVLVFLAIIFTVPAMTLTQARVGYSIFENRTLADPPVLTFDGLMDGNYLPQWEKFISDHIWKRNFAIKQYTNINMRVLRKKVVNNVVVLEDVLLPFLPYSYVTQPVDGQARSMAEKLSFLKEKTEAYGGRFIYIGVPEQRSMLRDYYPIYMNNDGLKMTIIEEGFFSELDANGIDYVNMRTEFLKDSDFVRFYSRTDHHYNLFGAFLTYQTVMNKLAVDFGASLPQLSESDIEFVRLDNFFYGSRSRKLYGTYEAGDKLYYYTLKNPIQFTRFDGGKEVAPLVFHLPEDETGPVTYDIYMNGDIAETVIRTNRENLPNALIFGDSFTNPLEVFLYNSFNETVSLDLRHYGEKSISEYIDSYKPDYVFCLRDDTAYLSPDGNGNIK